MRILRILKISIICASIALVATSCMSSGDGGVSTGPSNGSNYPNGNISNSGSSNSESESKPIDYGDLSMYPVSDPSTWTYKKDCTYAYKININKEVTFMWVYNTKYLPTEKVPDDLLFLDGFPFDIELGAKYVWDGKNLRCVSKAYIKPVDKKNLTYKDGYKFVCERSSVDQLLDGKWVKNEEVESEVEDSTSEVVVLDGVLLNDYGKVINYSYWHDGKYYWKKP